MDGSPLPDGERCTELAASHLDPSRRALFATKQSTKPYFPAGARTGTGKPPSNGHADHTGPRSNRMEYPMSIKTKFAALALAALAVTGTIEIGRASCRERV